MATTPSLLWPEARRGGSCPSAETRPAVRGARRHLEKNAPAGTASSADPRRPAAGLVVFRAAGVRSGPRHLIDLLEREAASGRTAEELPRRLVQAVLEHHGGLRDDATLLLVQWTGT